MESYSNYCTEYQTKRANKLGAPLMHSYRLRKPDLKIEIEVPTTQQMIGWLEDEKNIVIDIDFFRDRGYQPYIDYKDLSTKEFEIDYYSRESTPYYKTRKEAELAAIDTALDYLENKK